MRLDLFRRKEPSFNLIFRLDIDYFIPSKWVSLVLIETACLEISIWYGCTLIARPQ